MLSSVSWLCGDRSYSHGVRAFCIFPTPGSPRLDHEKIRKFYLSNNVYFLFLCSDEKNIWK